MGPSRNAALSSSPPRRVATSSARAADARRACAARTAASDARGPDDVREEARVVTAGRDRVIGRERRREPRATDLATIDQRVARVRASARRRGEPPRVRAVTRA